MVTLRHKINQKGWRKHFIMISTALTGKYIGLEAIEDGLWRVYEVNEFNL
jgi:hypothetical protein